jgi:hypothetical protein
MEGDHFHGGYKDEEVHLFVKETTLYEEMHGTMEVYKQLGYGGVSLSFEFSAIFSPYITPEFPP